RLTDPNYDGINVYGDETSADLKAVLAGIADQAPFLRPFIDSIAPQPMFVSRTGYNEEDILDPTTMNYKLSGSLNYKINPRTELILAGHWGTGTTVYTGSDRYGLDDVKIGQYKVELVNKNWLLRAWTTQENAGNSYNATITTRLLNEAWRPSVSRDANGNPAPTPTDW